MSLRRNPIRRSGPPRECARAVAVAVIFVWLGMVLAISFLEAPLKFRAPNVTLQIGLGIGRLVFRALNTVEVVLAIVILVTTCSHRRPVRRRRWRRVRRIGPADRGGAAKAESPFGPRARRTGCAALAGPLRLHRSRGDQSAGIGHGRDSSTIVRS